MASGVNVVASLDIGGRGERESAKQRRRDEYKQDLELQIQEKNAARQRERLQDMSVNASGYLDPEKRPDRFKPLGGVHWLDQRERKPGDRVKPYHTLFLYDRMRGGAETPERSVPAPSTPPVTRLRRVTRRTYRGGVEPKLPRDASPTIPVIEGSVPVEPLLLRQRRALDDNTAGIHYQPSTYAAAGVVPNSAVDQAYSFFGAHDLGGGTGGGGGNSIVQPISMPHGDSRPIIVHAQNSGDGYYGPRFNPFNIKGGNSNKDFQSLLLISQSEKDRVRRDNEDFQRRLRQELEDERRKLTDQENEARRRLEELRRQAEERRREAERERREAERLKNAAAKPKPEPMPPRPASKKTMLYDDMNDYRLRLIEERKKIEELLKAGKPVPQKEAWDLRVVRKPPLNLPPTPKSADRANRDNVNDFNTLKYRDIHTREEFRSVYPDVPTTNKRLEQQQEALIYQQEASLRDDSAYHRRPSVKIDVPPRRAMSRPSWLDRDPTPFPHVLRKRDKLYTAHSHEGDLDGVNRRIRERERVLNIDSPDDDTELEGLKLRHHRPASVATLLDDTWLRPSTKAEI